MTGSCAEASLDAGEELAGTATEAADWLLVEVPGAWGRDALADTALPDAVREALLAFPGRAVLVRRPTRRGTGEVAGVRVRAEIGRAHV